MLGGQVASIFRMMSLRSLLLLLLLVGCPGIASAQMGIYEDSPIHYSRRTPHDVMWEWRRTLPDGQPELDRSSPKAYLKSVLDELGIPVESQVLVFSQTSFQNLLISPRTPRAIYYNEDHYIGWVQGGDIEVATVDPRLGMTFYRFEVPEPDSQKPPEIERTSSCIVCHAGVETTPFPGTLVQSVYATETGSQVMRGKSYNVLPSTPLADRWGGWYVTGSNQGPRHRGNVYFVPTEGDGDGVTEHDQDLGASHRSLRGLFDTEPYLRDTSDIVSLLVLEHQTQAHNRILEAFGRTRIQLFNDDGYMVGDSLGPETIDLIDRQVDHLLDALLFKDEVSLAGERIEGDPAFQEAFLSTAHRDSKGRSLKDFDLEERIFRYRCSYMIYSKSFSYLPEQFRERFWDRLEEVLTAKEVPEQFAHLGAEEREAIYEIVRETHPDAAEYWD